MKNDPRPYCAKSAASRSSGKESGNMLESIIKQVQFLSLVRKRVYYDQLQELECIALSLTERRLKTKVNMTTRARKSLLISGKNYIKARSARIWTKKKLNKICAE